MKTTFLLIALLFTGLSGFSQGIFESRDIRDRLGNGELANRLFISDDELMAREIPNLTALGKMQFQKPQDIQYTPLVYNWTKAEQRIEDYKSLYYPKQDMNGRDLMLDIITDEMLDQLLQRILPH